MRIFHGLAVAATLLLAACSGLHSRAPVVQSYLLRVTPPAAPVTVADAGGGAGSATAAGAGVTSIQVVRPQARPGLETERIAILQPDHRADYYAGAQWAGQLPDLVESLIVDRLRAAGRWQVVEGSRSAFPAEYLLQVRISAFDAQYARDGTAPTVRVSMQGVLGGRVDREVLGEFSAEASAGADANRLGAVVSAFETAANAALDQLETGAWAAVRSGALRTSKGP